MHVPWPAPRLINWVLIVDPDVDARVLYRTVLSDLVHEVVEAEDDAEALGTAVVPRSSSSDSRLPQIDGYDLCATLRREQRVRSAAIVLIASGAYQDERRRATNAGADDLLVKPCVPEGLLDATYRSWRRRYGVVRNTRGDAA